MRNEKHIYFTSETKMEIDTKVGIKFPTHSFDIRNLDEVDAMKGDNRFLNGNFLGHITSTCLSHF